MVILYLTFAFPLLSDLEEDEAKAAVKVGVQVETEDGDEGNSFQSLWTFPQTSPLQVPRD